MESLILIINAAINYFICKTLSQWHIAFGVLMALGWCLKDSGWLNDVDTIPGLLEYGIIGSVAGIVRGTYLKKSQSGK